MLPQLMPQTMGTSVAANQSTSAFWFGIAKSTGSLLLSFVVGLSTVLVGYFIGALTWLLASLYAVVAWPVLQVYAPLRFLLSPITYTLSYVLGPLISLLHFIGRLKVSFFIFTISSDFAEKKIPLTRLGIEIAFIHICKFNEFFSIELVVDLS